MNDFFESLGESPALRLSRAIQAEMDREAADEELEAAFMASFLDFFESRLSFDLDDPEDV